MSGPFPGAPGQGRGDQYRASFAPTSPLGITGHPNRSGNDGTITRFGWKAQNKSITIFAGEAYNVEMGITNEAFPTATEKIPTAKVQKSRNRVTWCARTPATPRTRPLTTPSIILPDWNQFQILMRFTDGRAPALTPSESAKRGKTMFADIGCAL